MGTFKDIIDVATDLGKSGKDISDVAFSKKKYSSLSRKAAEGTLQFPVIISRNLDVESAQMISKALERNYASFAQIAMTMSHSFDIETDKDLAGYIRKFHQNQGIKASVNDIHNMLVSVDESVKESYNVGLTPEGLPFMVGVYEGSTNGVRRDNLKGHFDVLESIDTTILNNKFIPQPLFEADGKVVPAPKANGAKDNRRSQDVNLNIRLNQGQQGSNRLATNQTIHNTGDQPYRLPEKLLKDNDARKANELVPTMMHMRVRTNTPNGPGQDIDFLVGIKAFLHPVDSEEMVDNIVNGLQNKGKLFNFIRWTTGEISFFKDFLFGIKQMKLDVANQSSGHSGWWVALKRRKELAKLNNRVQLPTNVMPNATIVITMEEAEFIKDKLGYDLMNESVVQRLMKEYFLLGFTIVDVGAQIAHFMYDGQDYYQSISFSGLEKGTHQSGNALDIKDLMRLVQRV